MRVNVSIRVLALVAALSLPLIGAMPFASAASTVSPATGACTVRIARFAFTPDSVAEGDQTVLRLRIRNCTSAKQDVTVTQYGVQPPGCPVMDPVSRPVTIEAGGAYRSRSRMVAPSCAGIESMTTTVADSSGTQVASATAKLTVT